MCCLFTEVEILTKTKVGTRDWGIADRLTIFFFLKGIGALLFWVRKQLNVDGGRA